MQVGIERIRKLAIEVAAFFVLGVGAGLRDFLQDTRWKLIEHEIELEIPAAHARIGTERGKAKGERTGALIAERASPCVNASKVQRPRQSGVASDNEGAKLGERCGNGAVGTSKLGHQSAQEEHRVLSAALAFEVVAAASSKRAARKNTLVKHDIMGLEKLDELVVVALVTNVDRTDERDGRAAAITVAIGTRTGFKAGESVA